MAAAGKADGQEKVISSVQGVVRSLTTSKKLADELLPTLSGFKNSLYDLAIAGDKVMDSVQRVVRSLETSKNLADEMVRILSSDLAIASDVGAVESSESYYELSEAAGKVGIMVEAAAYLTFERPLDEISYFFFSAVNELNQLPRDTYITPEKLQSLTEAMASLFHHLMFCSIEPLHHPDFLLPLLSSWKSSDPFTTEDLESSEDEQQEHQHQHPHPSSSLLTIDQKHNELLKAIADCMIFFRVGDDLFRVYSSVCRNLFDNCLSLFEFHKVTIGQIERMAWPSLREFMGKWTWVMNLTLAMILALEDHCCKVFAEFPAFKNCLLEAVQGCIIQLVNFGDAVDITSAFSKELFLILGMYKALSAVISEQHCIFPDEGREHIISKAQGLLGRLKDATRKIISMFGNETQKDTSPLHSCDVHPLTRYVIKYLKLMVDYKNVLNSILDESSLNPTTECLHKLMSHLEAKLDEKSMDSEDKAFRFVFMTTNTNYIVQKMKNSRLEALLGDDWKRHKERQVVHLANCYVQVSWTKALMYLTDDAIIGKDSDPNSKRALKERLKNFNVEFESLCKTQTVWKVSCAELREYLRLMVSERVIQAYRLFIRRFGGHLEGDLHHTKHMKYTPEDLEGCLSHLFEGSALPPGGSSSIFKRIFKLEKVM
ncbi:hypothetical protein J5N97_012521 [Dioscorea zingiberensis]|uniref:Exocyst subunit Exo70 family protein n=1 Tax=Dioscorea zingiberensis TaxID=325984 RepID=A0A9D5CQG8_9LILI|nr:hypothetical protein J5N97_012521 [Dioscorea zingiberensis]